MKNGNDPSYARALVRILLSTGATPPKGPRKRAQVGRQPQRGPLHRRRAWIRTRRCSRSMVCRAMSRISIWRRRCAGTGGMYLWSIIAARGGYSGAFTFQHCLDDAVAAVERLVRSADAGRHRIDGKRLILIDHSLSGYVAAHVAAGQPAVRVTALISPANIGRSLGLLARENAIAAIDVIVGVSAALRVLSGTSPANFAAEAADHADR